MSAHHNSNETSIALYGVSDQLTAEFDMLREVNCGQGNIKFSRKTVNTLAQHIVCRHYGNLCYEFSHLNWAIIYANRDDSNSIQNGLVSYYWIEQCHWPQYFKTYFSDRCLRIGHSQQKEIALNINTSVNQNDEITSGITLRVYNHTFSISASRANIMACFMEWLICIVPDLLTVIEDNLHGKGHNAIGDFSSFLQKKIYDYLSLHLPPAKLQQRFRLIQSWYSAPQHSTINDVTLLMFWQQHSTTEGCGKYSNVVKDSLSYLTALEMVQASTNVKHANSGPELLESTSKQQENDDNLHFDWVSQYCARTDLSIARLLEAPKALNKQQVEFFELFSQYSQHLLPLSATWLRLQVFGKVQHQIIQMIRVKDDLAGNAQHYVQLCQTDYQNIKHQCIRLMASNQQSLLAISQVMMSFSPNQSCLILLKLMPQMPAFMPHTKNFASLLENAVSANKPINKKLVLQWQLSYPWVNALFKQAQLALKHINRHGFTPSTLMQSDDYLQCGELLFDLNKLIKQVLKQINSKELDSPEYFVADRLIFTNEFSELYGKDQS